MRRVKEFYAKISSIKGLKYTVVIIAAVLIVGIIDENSVWNHFCNQRKIAELESEIAEYKERYERDLKKLSEMDSDHKVVEKIARERYFMKKDDEEVFVLNTDIEEE